MYGMCIGCTYMSLDDLEEELFGFAEQPQSVNIQQQQQQHQPAVSSIRHRTWPWRHSQQNSPDDDVDVGQNNKANSSSSKDSSRRESINSSQGSPSKSSPKKKKDKDDNQSKKTDLNNTQDSVPRRLRKESKDRSVSPSESRMSAGARLYRVLEERTLDEVLGESVNLYIGNSRPVSLCSTAALSTNTWYRLIFSILKKLSHIKYMQQIVFTLQCRWLIVTPHFKYIIYAHLISGFLIYLFQIHRLLGRM